MQLKLSTKAINLLRHVLATDGKKIEQNGKEVFNNRTMNGFESSQRRQFFKKTEEVLKSADDKLQEMQKKHNENTKEIRAKIEKENPRGEMEQAKYGLKINALVMDNKEVKDGLEAIQNFVKEKVNAEYDIEITDNTFAVLKKYFKVYGDEAGFSQDMDEMVEAVEKIFA